MQIVADEDVPHACALVFTERGHRVRFVRDVLMSGTDDCDIAQYVNIREAVVVTCNVRHFKNLLPSVPTGARRDFRKASVISLTCPQPRGAGRLGAFMAEIEAEFARSRRGSGRMSVEVGTNFFRFNR